MTDKQREKYERIHIDNNINGILLRKNRTIAETEQSWINLRNISQNYWNYHVLPLCNEIKEKGKAHCKITHKYTGDFDPWWEYTFLHDGIGFNWVKEPANPVNLELGQKYYQETKICDTKFAKEFVAKSVLIQLER